MSDEIKLTTATRKAARAQELLGDDLLIEAFTGLEDAYTAAWRTTKHDEIDAREKLFLAINIVGKVRDHLIAIVNNGTLASAELRALAEVADRPKRWQDVRG